MSIKFCKDTDLAERFGVHRITIWRWVRENHFPRPVHFSKGCTRWNIEEVDKWEAEHKQK